MALHEYPDLIQGSDEWHDMRRGMVTASVVGQLLTATGKVAWNATSRGLTSILVAERITGWTDPRYVSDDMLGGHTNEPYALDVYAKNYAPVEDCGLMVREFGGVMEGAPDFKIGYSPDGLVGDDGLVEVKSRRPKQHFETILADAVPNECMAQIQGGLLVSGRKWCDYVSYCGGMPLYRKRVEPDPEWFDSILSAVEAFEQTAIEFTARYLKATKNMPATERVVELEMVI